MILIARTVRQDVECGELRVAMRYHPKIKLPENSVSLATAKPRMDVQLQRQRTMRLHNADLASSDVELSVEDVVFEDEPLNDISERGEGAQHATTGGGSGERSPAAHSKGYIHDAMDSIFVWSPSRREAELARKLEGMESEMQAAERRHAREKAKLQKEQQLVLSKVKVLEGALAKLPLDKLKKLSSANGSLHTPPPGLSAEKKDT